MQERPYKLPKGYLEYKVFQDHSRFLEMHPPEPLDVMGFPHVTKNLAYLYTNWDKGYPLYCVRDNLLEAMLQTDVGEKLELFADVELAIPFYTLFLPRFKVKFSSPNGYLDYLIINHHGLSLPEHKYAIVWGGVDSNGSLFLSSKRIRRDGTLQASAFTTENKEVQRAALTVRNIVLQSILLLQYYPEIEEQMTHLPGRTKGFSKPDTTGTLFKLPRWLGKEKKSYVTNQGLGRSKDAHFRKGFYRNQPCGQGRKEIKITWINPTWVNPEK